jgi:hypothetical protein
VFMLGTLFGRDCGIDLPKDAVEATLERERRHGRPLPVERELGERSASSGPRRPVKAIEYALESDDVMEDVRLTDHLRAVGAPHHRGRANRLEDDLGHMLVAATRPSAISCSSWRTAVTTAS